LTYIISLLARIRFNGSSASLLGVIDQSNMNPLTILMIENDLDDELLTPRVLKKDQLGNRILVICPTMFDLI
jgi:hypothetical protein